MQPQPKPLSRIWNALKPPPRAERPSWYRPPTSYTLAGRIWRSIRLPGGFTPTQSRLAFAILALLLLGAAGWGIRAYADGVARRAASQMQLGLEAMAGGDTAAAIDRFDRVIRFQPHSAEAHLERGLAHSILAQDDAAIADLSEAIRLDPNLARAYQERGKLYQAHSEPARAVDDFTRAIQLAPRPEAYYLRSQGWAAQRDYPKAIEDLDHAIGNDPKDAAFYTARAFARHETGDLKGAGADQRQALLLQGPPARPLH